MALAALYRRLLLAPFGGDERLLLLAAERLPPRGSAPTLYSRARGLSTTVTDDAPAAPPLSLAFLPAGGERSRRLREAVNSLPPGGSLVLLDHNAPRRVPFRMLATAYVALGWPLLRGSSPVRRLHHPVARELQGLGLEVIALRLLCGELFQAVLARKPAALPPQAWRGPGD